MGRVSAIPTRKISAKLPVDLVEWVDAEVAKDSSTDRTKEIIKALRQRQLSMLPKWQREQIYDRLGIAEGAESPAAPDEDGGDDG